MVKMRIAVIAANGRTGQVFVEAALAHGHEVVAGIYGKSFLDETNPRLTLRQCDATKIDDVRALINGQDAVVSLIGHVKDSPATVQTDAIQKIVNVMQSTGIKRIVSLTGTGVRFPGDRITIMDRILNASISIIDPARINDGKKHVEILKGSECDWTVIRVLKLQNVSSKPFELTPHGPTKLYVGRKEVALAILEVLEQKSFIHEAPILSK
jgi:hypothetical protein